MRMGFIIYGVVYQFIDNDLVGGTAYACSSLSFQSTGSASEVILAAR